MIQQTKFLGKAMFLLMTVLCSGVQASVAVLAPVVEVKGSATWTNAAGASSQTLRIGDSLAEGSVIKAGADGRVVFSPVPGAAVGLGAETSVTLSRLGVTKSGDAIQNRNALLKLDAGTLSFSLDKGKASTTTFGVQTPSGVVSAEQSAGTIDVAGSSVKLASLSGKMTFTATGSSAPITIAPGSFLVSTGAGANAQIRLVNVIAKTTTDFSADGTQLVTRGATVQELESGRGSLQATLAHVAMAAGYGHFSSEAMAEITVTLTQINQSYATVGIASVDAAAVGTSTPTASSDPDSAPAPTGMTSGTANPANLSGLVVSPER